MPPENNGTGQAAGFRAILFIAFRWMQTGRGGAHRSRLLFASLGIAAGIATLLAVLSVMNGFQRHYMETLIETSSFHVRADVRPGLSQEAIKQLLASLSDQPEVRSVLPFAETSMIVTDTRLGRQTVAKVLIVDFEQLAHDSGFIAALGLDRAAIARLGNEGAMIGAELARQLQLEQNASILLKGAAVSEEEGLVPYAAQVAASTIFKSGYYDVDAGLVLLSAQTAAREGVPYEHPTTLGIKLVHAEGDARFLMKLRKSAEGTLQHIESWREYNRSFFSALRTEKIVMFILISFIFAVVAINIHHATRRSIARKLKDLAILAATGAESRIIGAIFILEALLTGAAGVAVGFALGIPLALNMNAVINTAVRILDAIVDLLGSSGLVAGGSSSTLFSPEIFYIEAIPSRLLPVDMAIIAACAILFPLFASWMAFRRFRDMAPTEVLRSE